MLMRPEFHSRLANAVPGEQIIYYRGNLWRDRLPGSQLDAIATAAWMAHLRGECLLAQRLVEPQCYEYIAIKTAEVRAIKYMGAYESEFLAGADPRLSESHRVVEPVRMIRGWRKDDDNDKEEKAAA